MKLGLVIKITNNGESEYPLSFNKNGQWEKFAADARSSIKELIGFDETEKTVNLIKFLGSAGYLIGIIKSRPEGSGRAFDNVAAWVHFPSKISISDQETIEIIDNVEKAISGRSGVDDILLSKTFEKEYKSNDYLYCASDFISSNSNGALGIMYYGNNTQYELKELLGEYIAQPEYKNFKGIFLVNKNSDISINGIQELKIKVKPECSINAPKSIDGFEAYIGNAIFNKGISVTTGFKFPIVWKKAGFEDIKRDIVANTNISDLDIAIFRKDYKIIVQRQWFMISDETGKRVDKTNISIDGKQLIDSLAIAYDSLLEGTRLYVSKEGYSTFKKENYSCIENGKIKNCYTITLKKNIHHYEFGFNRDSINMDSYEDVRLIVETHHKLKDSPLRGFSSDSISESHNNELYQSNFKLKLRCFLYGFITCILTIILVAGWNAIDDYEFQIGWPPFKKHITINNEVAETGGESPQSDETGAPVEYNVDSLAIAYLDNNNSWQKDSLNRYSKTQGVFEALNSFDIEKLRNLNLGSEKLDKVIDAYNNASIRGLKPVGKVGGKYNASDDVVISIDNYIKWISENHSEKKEAPSESKKSLVKTKSNITGKSTKTTETPANSTTNSTNKNRRGQE